MIDEENQLDNAQNSSVGAADASESGGGSSYSGEGEEAAMADPVSASATVDDATATAETAVMGEAQIDYSAALAEQEQEIKTLKAQLEERTSQYMRIAADFDNYRKRTQREREELEQKVKCDTINEMLPVVDNFERARSQFKPQTDAETTIHKGYQGVYKQLVDCLKRVGVAPMRAQGAEFDPNLHEAVMRQPTAEFAEGTVMEELQRGYLLGERVLRHALVKVAAAPEADEPTDTVESSEG